MDKQMIDDTLEQALALYEDGRAAEAVKVFEQIADVNATAQFCLGEIYWNREVESDNADMLALYWYEKAAHSGNALAQLWLGNNYCIGIRSDVGPEEAVYWYKQAAAQNMALAQYHLAICYATGWGIEQDEIQAITWMTAAAKSGFFDADLYLAEYYRNQEENGSCYQQQKKMIEEKYHTKLQNDEKIAIRYAKFLLSEDSSPMEREHAFMLLTTQPIYKSELGCLLLAECYAKGLGTPRDVEKARTILTPLALSSRKAKNQLRLLTEG